MKNKCCYIIIRSIRKPRSLRHAFGGYLFSPQIANWPVGDTLITTMNRRPLQVTAKSLR